MLRTPDLFEPSGFYDKVRIATDRIRMFEPPDGYWLAFSGGKDSQCIYHLAKDAGVKFDAHFHLTTVDPPELIYFVRKHYPDVEMVSQKTTMWQEIVKNHMPPTRLVRYCCRTFKEPGGVNRVVMLGVRAQESTRRKNRQVIESCYKTRKTYFHPIVDWSEHDVWEYHREKGIPHCALYDEGFKRIGCIMCPNGNAKGIKEDAERWPRYYAAYMRAFDRMVKTGKTKWNTAEDVMEWWLTL